MGPRNFVGTLLAAERELDQVFAHFWHLQGETFSIKKINEKYKVSKKLWPKTYRKSKRLRFFAQTPSIWPNDLDLVQTAKSAPNS